jgi:hypothetical protein
LFLFRGQDLSLRVFDVENGMMLLEPMKDFESDMLARMGETLVARCGRGAALIILSYSDGDEELEE